MKIIKPPMVKKVNHQTILKITDLLKILKEISKEI
jgi:hypothetical protein